MINRKPENVSATICTNSKVTLTVNQWKHYHINLIRRLQEYEAVCVPYEQWLNHRSQETVCMAIQNEIDNVRLWSICDSVAIVS